MFNCIGFLIWIHVFIISITSDDIIELRLWLSSASIVLMYLCVYMVLLE
mgnify:CR=1 FL=1